MFMCSETAEKKWQAIVQANCKLHKRDKHKVREGL